MASVSLSSAIAAEQNGPQRFWGELSSTYRDLDSGSGGGNTNWVNTGTISGSSYLWRPWFALVNGSLSLSVDETETSGQPDTKNEFITGNGRLDLFPTSRFPFSTHYLKSRNEFDDDVFGGDVETTEYGARQSYRTWDGRHNYRAEYENSQRDDKQQNNFLTESLLLSAGNRLGDQTIDTDILLDSRDNKTTDEQSDAYAITVDHSLGDSDNLTMQNLLTATKTELDLFDSTNETETAQLSSFVTWHPRDNRDLRMTGSMRLLETRENEQTTGNMPLDAIDSETAIANFSQGLIYQYTDSWVFSESVSANFTEVEDDTVYTASEALSARYLAIPIITDMGDYVWSAGMTYNNLHGDIESEQSLDNLFSHSLLKSKLLESGYLLQTNLTQSFNYIYQSKDQDDKSINHSYSATWTNASVQNQNRFRFFVSDSRELNEDNDYFQFLNLEYTGAIRINRYSQFDGNATLQLSKQELEGVESEETTTNGLIRYRHSQAFQVPGMVFLSELQLSQRDSRSERVLQNPDTDLDVLWENSLQYSIGRLQTEVELDFIKNGDEYDRLFRFQVTRSFGDL